MTKRTTITLPSTVDALRDALRIAILTYSQTPVKNENKLNESLAKSLGFDNYDQLSALVKEVEANDDIRAYEIDFCYEGEQFLVINDYYIPTDLVHNEIVEYTVVDREERIKDLYRFISEANSSCEPHVRADIPDMEADLKTLQASEEKNVLEAYGTSGFFAGDDDPVLFNKLCNEMIEAAKNYFNETCGTQTKTGKKFDEVEYLWGEEECDSVYADEIVLIPKIIIDNDDDLVKDIARMPFTGDFPEGYMPAVLSKSGLWEPIEIMTRVTVKVALNEGITVFDMHDDDLEFEPTTDVILINVSEDQIANAALDVFSEHVGLSLPEQFTLSVIAADGKEYEVSDEPTSYTLSECGMLA